MRRMHGVRCRRQCNVLLCRISLQSKHNKKHQEVTSAHHSIVLVRCSMPQKAHVTLISAEGYEFVIDYKAACVSNTIRNMLSSSGWFLCSSRAELRPVVC